MPFDGKRRLVGLGAGAIQAGLFVFEAQGTGAYAPPLLVDIRADLVAALRAADGRFRVNIARPDRVDVVELGPVEVADPMVAVDRVRIVEAIADADELTTALPSVAAYSAPGPTSPHRLLAEGLLARRRPEPLLVICAENHRRAAAILEESVLGEVPASARADLGHRVRWIDSVIGKMSGVIDDRDEVAALGLATITPSLRAAFLVEEFDRILISPAEPGLSPADPRESRAEPGARPLALRPGMPALREVPALSPFEDAKLLGHNAIHALAGFLGTLLGVHRIAQLVAVPGCLPFLRAAFIEESGRALIARHAGADALFTQVGYAAFADDLLARMVNPHLADTVERAARDPRRKLGWDDRLVGLIRLGLAEGVSTPRIALGVAAGLEIVAPGQGQGRQLAELSASWPAGVDVGEADAVRQLVARGIDALGVWQTDGFPA
jgi:mannitol-1-phosphate/altronate dehydrogenase